LKYHKNYNGVIWNILRLLVGCVILTAAILKAYQLATTPDLRSGLLHARWFNIIVVEFELLFGIWLLSGLLQKLTWFAETPIVLELNDGVVKQVLLREDLKRMQLENKQQPVLLLVKPIEYCVSRHTV
jgi:hypothetical protein